MNSVKRQAPPSLATPPAPKRAATEQPSDSQSSTTSQVQYFGISINKKRVTAYMVTNPCSGFPPQQVQEILKRSVKDISHKRKPAGSYQRHGTFGQIVAATPLVSKTAGKLVVKYNQKERHFEDFMKEVFIHSVLSHRNIVPCLGYCMLPHTQKIFLLMPRIRASLTERLCNPASLPWETCLTMTGQIAEGLSYLHAKEIVHSDLAYRNILLDNNNHAFICDFGRATEAHCQQPSSITFSGDPYYVYFGHRVTQPLEKAYLSLAPELFYGRTTTTQSDIFGWGAITLNLLRGDTQWVTWTNDPECSFDFDCSVFCLHFDAEHHRKFKDLRSVTSNSEALTLDSRFAGSNYDQIQALQTVAVESLRLKPEERPNADELVQKVNNIRQMKRP